MKVITLKQPWATLLVRGFKRIETRSWPTKYVGELLIHASAKFDKADMELCKKYPFDVFIQRPEDLVLGAIIGSVRIDKVRYTDDVAPQLTLDKKKTELAFGDYSPGRYAWFCSNFYEFADPIQAKGSLGIWNYDGPIPELKEALL